MSETAAPVSGIWPVRGPAFPLAVRLLASALVAGLLYGALDSRAQLLGVDWNGWTATVVGWADVTPGEPALWLTHPQPTTWSPGPRAPP